MELFKENPEKQIVYGVIFEPDAVDAQDEFVSKDDIEDAAHDYLVKMRREEGCRAKLSHEVDIDSRSDIVESYVAPCDIQVGEDTLIKEGSWIVAMKIHDEALWKESRRNIVGYSAGGFKKFYKEGGES